jgi:hypothetical protein
LEVEGCLRGECAREDAVVGGVRESSAAPELVFIPKKKKVATARMTSLLYKVISRTSLICVELEPLPLP